MKLALIRRRFSSVGGAELYVQRLVASLADAGHELHFFTEQWDSPPEGTRIHLVPTNPSRALRSIGFAEQVDRMLPSQRFDCVFSFERTLRQDVYRAGDGVHRAWLNQRRRFAPWYQKPFTQWGGFHRNMLALEAQTFDPSRTRRIIVNSEMVRREILEFFPFPEERIHLVRNGIDVPRFQTGRRDETRKRFGFTEKDFVILFVGSGWERKGLKYVLQAVDQFGVKQGLEILENEWKGEGKPPRRIAKTPVKLLVVGKGRPPFLTSKDFVFAGAMPDVENAYAAADLFLFPPIYEPSANVVFEAMAAGLPVISSVQNGSSELIDEGVNGTVVSDPSNVSGLVNAIAYWFSHRFMLRPVDSEQLRLERNVQETLQVLELAASERRTGGWGKL